MRKLLLLIFIPILFILPIFTINAEKSLDFNLNCTDCHANAEKYVDHVNGEKYCEECHGNDVHPIHSIDCKECHQTDPLTAFCHGSPPDTVIPTSNVSNDLICTACHSTNIIETHPIDCQYCHQNINEIHREADVVGGVDDV